MSSSAPRLSLLNLPSEVFRHRVLEFLTLKNLVRLDSATLNHKQRHNLHLILRRSYVRNKSKNTVGHEAIRWLSFHEVYIDRIALVNVAEDCDIADLMRCGSRYLTLSLASCRNLSDTSACCIALNCATRLTYLDLNACTGMTNVGITSIVSRCTALTYLNLSNCRYITNNTILTIAQNCRDLRSINLTWCSRITDSSITELAVKCTNFRTTILQNTKITDKSIEAISKYCPHLIHVDISGCAKITDASLIFLGRHAIKLRSLHMSKCPLLTDHGVIVFSELCPKTLHSITARNCVGLTDLAFVAVGHNCQNIRFFRMSGL